jgi:hypothetical protein
LIQYGIVSNSEGFSQDSISKIMPHLESLRAFVDVRLNDKGSLQRPLPSLQPFEFEEGTQVTGNSSAVKSNRVQEAMKRKMDELAADFRPDWI